MNVDIVHQKSHIRNTGKNQRRLLYIHILSFILCFMRLKTNIFQVSLRTFLCYGICTFIFFHFFFFFHIFTAIYHKIFVAENMADFLFKYILLSECFSKARPI